MLEREIACAYGNMSKGTFVSQGAAAFQVILAVRLLPGVRKLSWVPRVHHLYMPLRVSLFKRM